MDDVARFRETTWTLGVVGLGYVGLPLAVAAARRGLSVIGFDAAATVVRGLATGRSHVDDIADDDLKAALAAGFEPTTDEAALRRCDAVVVCVPSPLGRHRQPDTTYIEAAAATIRRVAHPGMLVSLESTSYPGTTEELMVPAVEAAGLTLDSDVFVAFSPERVDPGNPLALTAIPKVVGGVTPRSGAVAAAAYGRIMDTVEVVSTARAAELTKLLENTYRAVNIALVNELAQLAHALAIDIWEVVDAAATKPFGYHAFRPGPGVGGHCIPLDPQYLAWRAKQLRLPTRFVDLADQVNLAMPAYVVTRVAELLNDRDRPIRGTPILGVGLAYKPNVADDRESPARDVLTALAARGARVGVADPHVPDERIQAAGFAPVDLDGDLGDWELAVVLTDHDAFDYSRLAHEVAVVFDTRGAYRARGLDAAGVETL